MIDTPIRFVPFLRPMVWGGRRLETCLHKPLPTGDAYGESWEISDHALHRSVVATGALAGTALRSLMENQAPALLGSRPAPKTFPWLVKFLDAADWLSVQVHPDEKTVRRLAPGEGSKTEAWFILAAEPGSRVYAGLKDGVDESVMRTALAQGTVADCLHHFEPRPGDCFFLPAGTVHAVGGGVLMAEVQQTSDATFRLFDWNRTDAQGRRRQLHIEEALASVHWQRGPVVPIPATAFARHTVAGGFERQSLVRCAYFDLDYVQSTQSVPLPGGRLQLVILIKGQGRWKIGNSQTPVRTGEAWLVPAAAAESTWQPDGEWGFLHVLLPEK